MTRPGGNGAVPFTAKLGYGAGNLGLQCVMNAAVAYLLYYYTEIVALAPL